MRTVFLAILLWLPLTLLSAHPHMLLHSRCAVETEGNRVKGVWIEFEFDRFFGAEVIWGYDEDRNGKFNKTETDRLYEGVLLSLHDYNYFTFIRVGDRRIPVKGVESFSARTEGPEILFFKFFVPLDDFAHKDFHIAVYDSTFFCSCRYQEDYFSLVGDEEIAYTAVLEENEDFPVYYNPQGAVNDLTVYESWKPGLNTFIPEEIHVVLEE